MTTGSNGDGRKRSGAGTRPRVVIAGGGIAGLAAAQVLADARFEVTVVEKAESCGGRCSSYFDEELGHTVEHGIHGVFPRYRNLRALFREAGIADGIFTDEDHGVAGPGRTMWSTELAKARGPAPFFLQAMVPPGVLRLRDYVTSLPILMRAYAAAAKGGGAFDANTFGAVLRSSGVSGRMADLLLVPYARNLAYARTDEISAGVALKALAYYVLENADDVKAEWIDGGMVPLVFDPWQHFLAARGVRFVMGRPVQSVMFDQDRFVAFGTRASISNRELGTGSKLLMRQLGAATLG